MVVELKGVEKTVFLVTIPGPAVGPTLEILRLDVLRCVILPQVS